MSVAQITLCRMRVSTFHRFTFLAQILLEPIPRLKWLERENLGHVA